MDTTREARAGSPLPAPGPPVLRAHDVTVDFGGLHALQGVEVAVRPGEVLGLIGPNGAGKTTLVNVLTGFQRPTRGRVVLGDTDVSGWPSHRRARGGLVRTFQSARLFAELSVRENVESAALAGGLGRGEARAATEQTLAWLGLDEVANQTARVLPLGAERRVGLARAVVGHPQMLLLDEPAAGLNDVETTELGARIRELPGRHHGAVILIDHDMSLVMDVCDRIHVLDHGVTVVVGEPAEVRADPRVIDAYLGADHG